SSNSGQLFALGIRGNNGAFTSIEALGPQEVKTKVISHVADGARWKTTIVVVNTDSVPAQFTVNFWKDDGSPFIVTLADGRSVAQVSDAIPVGGSRTIETDGLASALSTSRASRFRRIRCPWRVARIRRLGWRTRRPGPKISAEWWSFRRPWNSSAWEFAGITARSHRSARSNNPERQRGDAFSLNPSPR